MSLPRCSSFLQTLECAIELLCELEAVVLPNIISGTNVCGMYVFSKLSKLTLNICKIGLIQTSTNLKKPGIFSHVEI